MPPLVFQTITNKHPSFPQVWELREEVLRKPLGLSLRDEDLAEEVKETIITATDEAGKVVGCVMMKPLSPEEVKLRQMAVAPEHQGKGVGKAIVREAETWARQSGYKVISLHARDLAAPFYQKAGYAVQGDLFTEVGIPHLFMNKTIQ